MDRSTPPSFIDLPVETSYLQDMAPDNEFVNPRPVVGVIQDGQKPHTIGEAIEAPAFNKFDRNPLIGSTSVLWDQDYQALTEASVLPDVVNVVEGNDGSLNPVNCVGIVGSVVTTDLSERNLTITTVMIEGLVVDAVSSDGSEDGF
ncbi:hypothetical protein L1887_27368 [Cichorium endivia]|nr:hypothetical protein L1887_27368 [Cichorium endivia]